MEPVIEGFNKRDLDVLMGDFNAEQVAPDTHDAPEARLVGQHTFFKKEDLNALSECRREQILDAGDRVKETRVGNELVAANTLFEKKAAKKGHIQPSVHSR